MGTGRSLQHWIRFGLARSLCVIPLVSFSFAVAPHSLARAAERSFLTEHFDAAKEFPNYFMPEEFRGKPLSEIPPEILARQEALLNRALGSVFERLVIPIVHEGEKDARPVRYFPYLKEHLSRIDPEMRLYASGGVVRAGISYLYDEVTRELENHPERSAQEVLEEIARRKEDIPAIRVRGVGSDFDLLMESPGGKIGELKARALAITNGASRSAGEGIGDQSVKNTFFTYGDVREYQPQIERSTRQGGTVVDYLAFDVASQKLRDPPRFPGLSKMLVSGHYQYAPPADGAAPEDLGDSVVRGARTLLELPWLKLDNESYYREQIAKLKGPVLSGNLSQRALGQFAKGVRNSRYFGAHNRFYRARPGTAESDILELATLLGKGNPSRLLPEFADARKISLRDGKHSELNGLPESLLMPISEFKEKFTDHGVLHHGTPSIKNALAILRQGLFLSKETQGNAVYGRGVYTSPYRDFSAGHAGAEGLIFDLEVKDDPRINILNWKRLGNTPEIQGILARARSENRDPFEYLSREHGIDVIVNHHVLIQNSDVFKLEEGLKPIAQSIARNLLQDNNPSIEKLLAFLALNDYLRKTGEAQVTISTDDIRKIAIRAMDPVTAMRGAVIWRNGDFELNVPGLNEYLRQTGEARITIPPEDIRKIAIRAMDAIRAMPDATIWRHGDFLLDILKSPSFRMDDEVKWRVNEILIKCFKAWNQGQFDEKRPFGLMRLARDIIATAKDRQWRKELSRQEQALYKKLLAEFLQDYYSTPQQMTALLSLNRAFAGDGGNPILSATNARKLAIRLLDSILAAPSEPFRTQSHYVIDVLQTPALQADPEVKARVNAIIDRLLSYRDSASVGWSSEDSKNRAQEIIDAIPDPMWREELITPGTAHHRQELAKILSENGREHGERALAFTQSIILKELYKPEPESAGRLARMLLNENSPAADRAALLLAKRFCSPEDRTFVLTQLLVSSREEAVDSALAAIDWQNSKDAALDEALLESLLKGPPTTNRYNALKARPDVTRNGLFSKGVARILDKSVPNIVSEARFIRVALNSEGLTTEPETLKALSKHLLSRLSKASASEEYELAAAGAKVARALQGSPAQAEVIQAWLETKKYFVKHEFGRLAGAVSGKANECAERFTNLGNQ